MCRFGFGNHLAEEESVSFSYHVFDGLFSISLPGGVTFFCDLCLCHFVTIPTWF